MDHAGLAPCASVLVCELTESSCLTLASWWGL